jgi:protein involved in sex pheromone biosynthesis
MGNKKLLNPRKKRGKNKKEKKNPKYFGNLLKISYQSGQELHLGATAITRNSNLLRPKWSSELVL